MERTGKLAENFLDIMKAQPTILGLLVVIGALIGFIYYQGVSFNTQRKDNVALFVDVQREVQKLLSQCIVPAPERRP